MKHPADSTLALYAGRELGLWPRFHVTRHLRACERCNRHVEEFYSVREFAASVEDDLPAGLEWGELASEMKANIRLGIAAGRCVGEAERDRVHMPWRTPALVLPVLLVILVGWLLQSLPPPLRLQPTPGIPASAVVLDGGPAGLGVEQNGRGFRLLHPRAENAVYTVRGNSVRSRYVDSDTGQVTISHVYAE